MNPAITLEQQRIEEVARDYRSKGYEVIVQPGREHLPDFLSSYQPDLLARRGEEAAVVEVMSRTALTRANHLRGLAKEIQAHPGWRFDLVVTNPPILSEEEIATSLREQEVARTLHEVERLLQQDQVEAALLLAWSAAEAALRLLALREGVSIERRDPLYLLKQLTAYAVILPGDYNALVKVLETRNRVAHGFRVQDRDMSRTSAQALLEMVSRLLDLTPAG